MRLITAAKYRHAKSNALNMQDSNSPRPIHLIDSVSNQKDTLLFLLLSPSPGVLTSSKLTRFSPPTPS
jgi:hypothetical protein